MSTKTTWCHNHMFMRGIVGPTHRDDLARIIRLARDRSSLHLEWGNVGVRRIKDSYFIGNMHFFKETN